MFAIAVYSGSVAICSICNTHLTWPLCSLIRVWLAWLLCDSIWKLIQTWSSICLLVFWVSCHILGFFSITMIIIPPARFFTLICTTYCLHLWEEMLRRKKQLYCYWNDFVLIWDCQFMICRSLTKYESTYFGGINHPFICTCVRGQKRWE